MLLHTTTKDLKMLQIKAKVTWDDENPRYSPRENSKAGMRLKTQHDKTNT